MSIIGVTIGLYLTGNPLSMPVGVGFISLMGIVVNDAIVMIDKINKNIAKGMELKLSITQGALSRLNPILVTTVTTVAGILPIALQDVFWAGLGFTIAFGLTTGSLMTLFAIPTLYYSLESRKYKNKQNKEYIEKQEEKKKLQASWIKTNIFKNIFQKKNIKYFVIIIILAVIVFGVIRSLSPVDKQGAITPEIREIIQKSRSGKELSPDETKILEAFKEKNKSAGGGRGGGRQK